MNFKVNEIIAEAKSRFKVFDRVEIPERGIAEVTAAIQKGEPITDLELFWHRQLVGSQLMIMS